MTTKTLTFAQQVNKVYPSFVDILSKSEYNIDLIKDPIFRGMCKVQSQAKKEMACMELVAMAIDSFMENTLERRFTNSFVCEGKKGWAIVYDSMENKHQVTSEEFQALLKIFWFSWVNVPMSKEQHKIYREFKGSSSKIWDILD